MTQWLERLRYSIGVWLVPETAQLNDVLIQLERHTAIIQAQEQELKALGAEKGILQDQVAFLKHNLDTVNSQFDVVKSMADRFYADLKDSQQKFTDYTTGQGAYTPKPPDNDVIPDMIHPEYAAQMIAQMITQEAESMYPDDDMGPPVSKRSH